jgi:putative tryptophan/tyrosine transport system substrate-binding protein
VSAFRKGLRETGFVEDRNVAIEYRFAQNERARLPEFAADLVRRQVAVIAAFTLSAALAVKAATTTIPIVFGIAGDPIQTGLVARLNRPGGNVTGANNMSIELDAKRFELLHALLPAARRFAVLIHRASANVEFLTREALAAGSAIGLQIEILYAGTDRDIDAAFATLVQKGAEGLLVSPDPLFFARPQILTLAARHAVPAMFPSREDAEAGGLMSYGASIEERERQVGIYTGRILKGEKPADLPVIQPTKFELVINLKTAKAFGLAIPPNLLALADEVIE